MLRAIFFAALLLSGTGARHIHFHSVSINSDETQELENHVYVDERAGAELPYVVVLKNDNTPHQDIDEIDLSSSHYVQGNAYVVRTTLSGARRAMTSPHVKTAFLLKPEHKIHKDVDHALTLELTTIEGSEQRVARQVRGLDFVEDARVVLGDVVVSLKSGSDSRLAASHLAQRSDVHSVATRDLKNPRKMKSGLRFPRPIDLEKV